MKLHAILHSSLFAFLFLLFSTFLLYVQTFSGAWLMDDFPVIVNNPDIRSLANFLTNSYPGRPLREISCLLDYSLFGLDPWGYHFQNIFWHALNCWLVYLLAIRLNLSTVVAWLSSLLFLVHPIHVEVVANSSHRKDSLALAFLLMALLSYMEIFEQKYTLRRLLFFGCAVALWTTAFFAKGNSLVFPALVLVYEYALVPEENRILVRWNNMVPFLSIISVVGLIGWLFYVSTLPSFKLAVMAVFVKNESLATFSTSAYLFMVLKSYAFMFFKLILPLNLSMEYIYDVPKSLLDPWVIFAMFLTAVFCCLVTLWKKTSPQLFFLLACSAVIWLPTSNILWNFSYFAADRYMYAPSAFLCILAVKCTERGLLYAAWRYYVVGWLCVVCICSVLTWKQSKVWLNEMSFHSQMLKVSPRSLEGMIGLSNAYYSIKNYDKSEAYAKLALQRDFTDSRPYMILGNIYYVRNQLNDALQLLLESQKKNPLSAEVHNNLGSVYDELGLFDKAVDSFETALKLRHGYFEANTNLGVTYERAGKLRDAESVLNKALAANSNYVPAWFNLGVVRYKKNDIQGARTAFSEVLSRDPYHTDALSNLATTCKESGDEACYNDAVRRLTAIMPNAVGKPR